MTFLPALSRYLSRSDNLNTLRHFYGMYCRFQARTELSRLVRWAEKRRFSRVARYYRFLYSENEQRLARDAMCFQRLCKYAQLASAIYQFVFQPKPTRKGAGQAYRLRKRSLIWSQPRLGLY